ncbi:MAG: hypothetical protein L0Y72_28840 [Gemmataceae bacterium]|nr:hypothetical protein [Gemmataceae bacterium]MCI0743055.1 hypothetical protein [Gemmataceae bacterium]
MRTTQNGTAEIDRLITDLRAHTQELIKERDQFEATAQRLQKERDALAQSVAVLKEKCDTYAPYFREYAMKDFTQEQAEAIVRENRWVCFEEVMRELRT